MSRWIETPENECHHIAIKCLGAATYPSRIYHERRVHQQESADFREQRSANAPDGGAHRHSHKVDSGLSANFKSRFHHFCKLLHLAYVRGRRRRANYREPV